MKYNERTAKIRNCELHEFPKLCNNFNTQQDKFTWILHFIRFWEFFHSVRAPSGPRPPQYRGFKITRRHITLGKSPLDKWSARRRDLYLTTHNTHKRQTCMPLARFEPAIPASQRLQTHALNRAAKEIMFSVLIEQFLIKTVLTTINSVRPSFRWR